MFTLDLSATHDTDANRTDASPSRATCGGLPGGSNPVGTGSKWCGDAFIAKLSADLTVNANLK